MDGFEPVNDLRLHLHQPPQRAEAIETFTFAIGKLPPKIDLLDLSLERETLIG